MANKVMKRKYIIGLFVLLAMATVTTYAWSAEAPLATDPTTVYVSAPAGSTTTISSYSSKPLGKNKIEIKFTLSASPTNYDFMFIGTDGEILSADVAYTVATAGGTQTGPTSGVYSVASTAVSQVITITDSTKTGNLWKSLTNDDGSGDEFHGLMIVIK
ncbi:TPA: hypothetical protein HA344_02730 [Candidatus Bathyarchaeota archaeon]|nr:hypothetical protein [Candidatus Bathyarchaeota archaeon]